MGRRRANLLALCLCLLALPAGALARGGADPTAAAGTAARASGREAPPRTVRRALKAALAGGHITPAGYRRGRRAYRDARLAAARLRGRRRAEIAAVIAQVRAMARTGALRPSRLRLAVLTLERNARFWSTAPLPAGGQRFSFGRDGLVWQHYSGAGLQVQPLASFGKANALARMCRDGDPRTACRRRKLRRLLSALVGLAAQRGGAPAWEHWFAFGGARAGWVSGMTQGTAVQALARGAEILRERRFLLVARRAVRVFERRPPLGVAVPSRGGREYVMYSTRPSLRILNGHLQATIGLRDLAMHGGGAPARRAYRRGERAARRSVGRFDTGAWSLYSDGGREASLGYHRLVRTFLARLCGRTRRGAYCAAQRRFARYLREPPRVRIEPTGVRVRPLRFTLSKVSVVTVSVTGRRGLAVRRTMRLGRGSHTLPWRPARSGRYRVSVAATGLSGPRAATARTVVVPRARPSRR